MRATTAVLILLASISLMTAGTAVADTVQSSEEDVYGSTGEALCDERQEACEGPSATTRVSVSTPSLSVDDLDASCLTETFEAGDEARTCEPEIGSPGLSAHLGIHGLDLFADSGDDEASSQGGAAHVGADDDEGMLSGYSGGLLLFGAIGVGASGMAATVGLRRFVTVLLAPLASRLKRSELLDNDKRRAIYEKISEDPGINLRNLADELDLAWGTLLHHLRKLEDNHLVTSERFGKYRRFFLNGSTYSEDEQARLAALATPSTARVAEYILDNPGANQSEIGDAIGVTASTVLFHVRRLKDVDLVEEEREGRYVHYYPKLEDHEAQQLAAA